MASGNYQVVLTGELASETSPEAAISGFCELFKCSAERGGQVFANAPIAIKKGADEATAKAFQKALNKIGIVTRVEAPEAPEAPATESATPAPIVPAAPAPAPLAPESEDDPSAASSVAQAPVPTPETAVSNAQENAASTHVETLDASPAPSQTRLAEAEQPGFKFKIEGQPDFAYVTVQLPANEKLKVEASAMATMDTNINMKTKAKGGLGRLLTSESIFVNEFTAEAGPGEIGIAPGAPGDLVHVYLRDETVYLQNSAFVASGMDVETATKWQGLTKGFFSGESLFLIRCSGNGDLWFNTYGGMIELDVDGNYVVDTGNIVAFTEGLEYHITKVGGYKALFFSGEGFVCRFSGAGKVWIQTRSVQAFSSWLAPFRPGGSGRKPGLVSKIFSFVFIVLVLIGIIL